MSIPHVLVVEDEEKLARATADYLKANGFQATVFGSGSGVVECVKESVPHAILLDVMLPEIDGLTLCRAIRAFSDVPILMVTARVEEIDRLLGLEAGADDYICKPFSLPEVIARLRAVMRRSGALQDKAGAARVDIDFEQYEARVGNRSVPLTQVELRLLRELMKRPGKVFSRLALMSVLYEDRRIVSDRTIDSHVRNLRRKFDELGVAPIDSVYGVGFRFVL